MSKGLNEILQHKTSPPALDQDGLRVARNRTSITSLVLRNGKNGALGANQQLPWLIDIFQTRRNRFGQDMKISRDRRS
jgi:hypothetical protein